jgi:hypothetical protein
MKFARILVRSALFFGLGSCLFSCSGPAGGADPNPSLPPIIQSGFTMLTKGGVDLALDVWRKGGLMEAENKPAVQSAYFKRLDRALGNYRSWEPVELKKISPSSMILYLSMNFDRGAVYARFVLYRTAKDWVVQNMDFSTKPEAIMPWLAFEASGSAE